jgi:hypothetical protein
MGLNNFGDDGKIRTSPTSKTGSMMPLATVSEDFSIAIACHDSNRAVAIYRRGPHMVKYLLCAEIKEQSRNSGNFFVSHIEWVSESIQV